jgi:predicted nucleic acid-binding protein
MGGLTLDTGALIALERARERIREIVAAAQAGEDRITVPTLAIAEWWRGTDTRRRLIRGMFDVEPLDESLAKVAGQALGSPRKGHASVDARLTIDAIVMASAARPGDLVFTSDVEDLDRFRRYVPSVRILSV